MNLKRLILTILVAGLVPVVASDGAVAQETGSVTGQITDAATGQPLTGVQVFVAGTDVGTITNADGRYLLQGVPPGEQEVSLVMLGYGEAMRGVEVTSGETAVLDVELAQIAIALDEVVVTAVGEQRRRELGNAVATIETTELVEIAPVTSMATLLQARSPGVQVFGSSGTPGTGSRIRIRGANSMSLSNEPLVYMDGIRVSSSTQTGLGTGGQEPSRLDDLNPEDIESIEVVKGPAAATLYGTEAANGVIRITTKRGAVGEARWNVWLEGGLTQEPNDYPLNYAGLTSDGETCFLFEQVADECAQSGLSTYQVLDDPELSPIDDGHRRQIGASVSGGSEAVTYYISGEMQKEVAPYRLPDRDRQDLEERNIAITDDMERPQNLERASIRANLNARVADNANVALNTGFVSSDLSLTANDNNSFGFLPSAFFGGAIPEEGYEGGWGFQRPAQLFGRGFSQSVERYTSSLNGTWAPLPWLQARATGGLDYVKQFDNSFLPRDIGVPGLDNGSKDTETRDIFQYTLDAVTTARFDLTPTMSSKTSVGVQYVRDYTHVTEASGEDIPPGASSIGAAAQNAADEAYGESKTLGVFVEEQVGFNDRLFVTGALRADDNSTFGRDFDAIYYPKATVSWMMSEEPFFPDLDWMDELRLRVAAGRSGLQPGSTDALRTLDANAITDPTDETVVGVRTDELGNSELEPEQSGEIEGGFDVGLFDDRIGLEATYYHKRSAAALINAPLAPSLGADPTRWINVGTVRNRGVELGLNAIAFSTEPVQIDLNVSGSWNDNELVTLENDVEPTGIINRNAPGFPLGGWWAPPILGYEDADGDGIIGPGEIEVGDTATFIGPSMPERELSVGLNATFLQRFGLYMLFDHRGDYFAYNNTERFRCLQGVCRALHDAAAAPEDQARASAAVFHPSETIYGYIEKADFWKLREMSLSYAMPAEWAGRIGAGRATITLTGRNIATWTDYGGLDPEINSAGASDNFGTTEFLTQPPIRYWTVRVSLGF